jgi:hypothetical protein
MGGRVALTLSTLKRQTGVLRLCIRAGPFVIASKAKQSILQRKEKEWIASLRSQ